MKKCFLFFSIFITGLLMNIDVHALTNYDVVYDSADDSQVFLEFKNYTFESGKDYYLFYDDSNNITSSTISIAYNEIDSTKLYAIYNTKSANLSSLFELNKDNYQFYILKLESPNYIVDMNYINVARTDFKTLSLGNRINVFWQDDSTAISLHTFKGINTTRNLKYKIGKITDYDIISQVVNKEPEGLNKLLNYAKENTALFEDSIEVKINHFKISDKLNIENKAYYFGYYELDTENGKYAVVEDVDLMQGYSSSFGTSLISYTNDNFEFVKQETKDTVEPTTETTTTKIIGSTKNVETGIQELILPFLLAFAFALIVLFKSKNFNLFKKY